MRALICAKTSDGVGIKHLVRALKGCGQAIQPRKGIRRGGLGHRKPIWSVPETKPHPSPFKASTVPARAASLASAAGEAHVNEKLFLLIATAATGRTERSTRSGRVSADGG